MKVPPNACFLPFKTKILRYKRETGQCKTYSDLIATTEELLGLSIVSEIDMNRYPRRLIRVFLANLAKRECPCRNSFYPLS